MKEKVVTSYYDYMCSLKRVLHKNDNFRETTRIRMIICKRPVHLHDHLQPRKGHEKCIIETFHNEIKRVLKIKESNFNEYNGSKKFIFAYGGHPPLPPGQPDRKISLFFATSLK